MFCFVSEHISNVSSFSFLVLEYYWPVVQTDKKLIVCGWNSQQIGCFSSGTVFKLSNTIAGCLWWGTEIKLNQIYVACVHQFDLHQNCNGSIYEYNELVSFLTESDLFKSCIQCVPNLRVLIVKPIELHCMYLIFMDILWIQNLFTNE